VHADGVEDAEIPVDRIPEPHPRAIEVFGVVQVLGDQMPDEGHGDDAPHLRVELVLVAALPSLVRAPYALLHPIVDPPVHGLHRVLEPQLARRDAVDLRSGRRRGEKQGGGQASVHGSGC
jgi:hypothetical protein